MIEAFDLAYGLAFVGLIFAIWTGYDERLASGVKSFGLIAMAIGLSFGLYLSTIFGYLLCSKWRKICPDSDDAPFWTIVVFASMIPAYLLIMIISKMFFKWQHSRKSSKSAS